MKRVAAVLLSAVFALSLCACAAQQSSNKEENYADDEAITTIARGLEKRSDLIDKKGGSVSSGSELKEVIQTEIDNDKGLRDRSYKDSKLQEKVIAYLNTLDESVEVINNNAYLSPSYATEWQKVYDKRTALIKTFVDEYHLSLSGKYEKALSDLVANGASATKKASQDEAINALVSSATWEKTDNGHGSYTYTAIIENTSDYSFSGVSLTLGLFDADGVKTEGYAHANTWNRGEKVKFEAHGTVDAQTINATVQYYNVSE